MTKGGGSGNGRHNKGAPPPQDPTLNPLSEYHIHLREHPSTPLVSPLLTMKNYHNWSRAMKRSLISKNEFKFVNGSLPTPSTFDPTFDAWERCNNLVLSWILNSIDPILSQSIQYVEVVATAWKLLKDRFSRGDRVRIFELQQELMAMKQGTNPVAHYFTKLTTLWDELDNYRPLLDCVCSMKYVCVASKNGRLFKEEDRIMKFLSGLNEEFDVVRTQFLMMEPFPDAKKALSLVWQHERRIGSSNNDEGHVFINATEGRGPFGKGKGGSKSYGFDQKGNLKLCRVIEK